MKKSSSPSPLETNTELHGLTADIVRDLVSRMSVDSPAVSPSSPATSTGSVGKPLPAGRPEFLGPENPALLTAQKVSEFCPGTKVKLTVTHDEGVNFYSDPTASRSKILVSPAEYLGVIRSFDGVNYVEIMPKGIRIVRELSSVLQFISQMQLEAVPS